MPWDRVILAGLVAAAGLVFWILFRFTRVGLGDAATTENEKGALLPGFAPDRQAMLNWVLGSLVAAAIGILLRGILPLDPTSLTLVIVPALAAALVGNFTSFGITIAAGLAIGALRQEVTFFQTKSWFPSSGGLPIPGVREALPFVVIVIFMFLRGRALPQRGAVVAGRLPSAPRLTAVPWRAGIGVVLAAIGLLTPDYEWREAIINSTVGAVLTRCRTAKESSSAWLAPSRPGRW
jgi:branched-chain amino acid transport system permease protein